MLVHDKCKTVLQAKYDLEIIGPVGISVNGIRLAQGNISFNDKEPVKLTCPDCKVTVSPENILCPCSKCWTILPITEVFLLEGVGGLFCKTCKPQANISVYNIVKGRK